MPTRKTASTGSAARGAGGAPTPLPPTAAYEAAVKEFATALESLQKGDTARAKELFESLEQQHTDEPELVERARTYVRVCDRRMAPPAAPPESADDCYHQAVVCSNEGEWDRAIELFDRAFSQNPSADVLYGRASSWALKGNSDRAIADLRDAISMNPLVRFQAVNDPDFEKIREEPTFIDIIEPTSTGT